MAPYIKYRVGDTKIPPPPIYLIHGNKTKGMSPLTRVDILKNFFPYLTHNRHIFCCVFNIPKPYNLNGLEKEFFLNKKKFY